MTAPAGVVVETAPLLVGSAGAVLSVDRVYRYSLHRTWGTGRRIVLWVMLNPSTADALADDPTIRRCIAFARAWKMDGLTVVNLFALRSPDPRALAAHSDPVGPACDQYIAAASADATVTVAAWGAHPAAVGRRAAAVMALLGGADLRCLGVTQDGHPRHPLFVRADQPHVAYRPEVRGAA